MNKSCLIIAGEKSGEEHAMSFLPQLLETSPDVDLFGVGGDEMAALGVELKYHLKDFSSWGVSEVIKKIPFYIKAHKNLIKEVERRQCKTAILIDFQDFNLRLAKKLKKMGVKVLYYVAPQAWAWKAHRAKTLAQTVHTLFTIIPFEKKWFGDRGVRQCKSVPHPLWFHYKDQLSPEKLGLSAKPFDRWKGRPRVLCLPGSRNSEVKLMLPPFVESLKALGEVEAGIVISPNVNKELYKPYLKDFHHTWHHDELNHALEWTDFAMATSGTVTLTCALFEVPTVVCYSSSLLNVFIFYTFLSYNGPISLANIVHNRVDLFPEMTQERVTSYNISQALKKWMLEPKEYEKVKRELAETINKVSGELDNVGEFMGQVINSQE